MIAVSQIILARDYMKTESKALCFSVFAFTETLRILLITLIYGLLLEIDIEWLTSLSFPFLFLLWEHMAC